MRDQDAMQEALRLAASTARLGNVPVGAVVLINGRMVGSAANLRDTLHDPTAHAELLALRSASQAVGSWRLEGATMVVTLEPCAMCAGALQQARVTRLVYGAADPRAGAVENGPRLLDTSPVEVECGMEGEEATRLLEEFFSQLRRRRRTVDRES